VVNRRPLPASATSQRRRSTHFLVQSMQRRLERRELVRLLENSLLNSQNELQQKQRGSDENGYT